MWSQCIITVKQSVKLTYFEETREMALSRLTAKDNQFELHLFLCPQTLKKLRRHIALGLSVHSCSRQTDEKYSNCVPDWDTQPGIHTRSQNLIRNSKLQKLGP